MLQTNALNGDKLDVPIALCSLITTLFNREILPKGLIGIDKESGLALVAVTRTKRQHIKIGRLLKKENIPDDKCRKISGELKATLALIKGAKLKFARSEEEIYRVYDEGPSSCMSREESVRCYSTDSVGVAYIEIEDRIVSRSVVCLDEEIGLRYVTIYGNSELMEPLLEEGGFVSGSLEGCSLKVIKDNNGRLLCPYLDCGSRATVRGDFIDLESFGDFSTSDTCGYLGSPCCDCGEILSEDALYYSDYIENYLCESCFDKCHVYINGSTYNIESDDIVSNNKGEYYLKEETVYSEYHNEYIHVDDSAYSDYIEDYLYNSEVITAITNVGYPEGEICLKDDCTLYNNKWIHDDILEEYTQQDLFEDN